MLAINDTAGSRNGGEALDTAVAASGFGDAVAAFKRGDYATALLGFCNAAEQGDMRAQYNLGIMYDNGEGVQQNYAAAFDWYKTAAERGYTDAQYNLAKMYSYGQGVGRDYVQAVYWYRTAAEQGDVEALYNLGVMYNCGEGVVQDLPFAHMWFSLAASNMSPGKERGGVLKIQEMTAHNMTVEQIAEAERLEREWREAYE